MFFYTILGVHIFLCVVLVLLVLMQQGKGADMGAAFGGGANTLFGAAGATALITKITTSTAVAFFVTSILLAREYSNFTPRSTMSGDPTAGSVMAGVEAPRAEEKSEPVAAASEQAPPVQVVVPPAEAAKANPAPVAKEEEAKKPTN